MFRKALTKGKALRLCTSPHAFAPVQLVRAMGTRGAEGSRRKLDRMCSE